MIYGVYRWSGTAGVTLFFLTAWLATFFLWVRTAHVREHPVLGLPLTLVAILACQTRFEERPDVVSWLLLTAFVLALARPGPPSTRTIVLLGVAQVVWTNVHGYFFLGPVLALLALGGRGFSRRLALFIVLLAGSLVSPFGLGTWSGVFQLGRLLGELRFAIEELNPPLGSYLHLWTIWVFWLCWATTALAVAGLLIRKREVFACLLAAAGLALSAASLRNLPAVGVFSGPLWAAVLPRASGPRLLRRVPRSIPAIGVSLLGLALMAWTVEGGFYRSLAARVRFGTEPYGFAFPARFASSYLRATGWRGIVFNHPSDGGYLEFHFPDLRLYGDSRFTEPGPVREYLDALFDPRAFLALDARHHFDAVLVNLAGGEDPLLRLLELPDWKLAYADLHRALIVNKTTPRGGGAPNRAPSFYSGEDLSIRLEGYCAVRWAYVLTKLERPDLLLVFLQQIAGAKQIPSPVLAFALDYGHRSRDGRILEAARALRPRMLALTAEDAAAVERLMGNTSPSRN